MTGPSVADMMGYIRRRESFTEPTVRYHVSSFDARMLRSIHAFLRRYWTSEPYGLRQILWRPGRNRYTGGQNA